MQIIFKLVYFSFLISIFSLNSHSNIIVFSCLQLVICNSKKNYYIKTLSFPFDLLHFFYLFEAFPDKYFSFWLFFTFLRVEVASICSTRSLLFIKHFIAHSLGFILGHSIILNFLKQTCKLSKIKNNKYFVGTYRLLKSF